LYLHIKHKSYTFYTAVKWIVTYNPTLVNITQMHSKRAYAC